MGVGLRADEQAEGPGGAPMGEPARLAVTYLVPICVGAPDLDLVGHLTDLTDVVEEVIVVDASDDSVFAAHGRRLPGSVRHLRPATTTRMGKVGNVLTGLRLAAHDVVVIADDDVRWTRPLLERAIEEMGGVDVARPQNRFDPAPWHARWDTGRTLVNRALSGDWPGTLLVRASALPEGYSGDALFENLELVRTVRARGGTERVLFDVIVPRTPPTTRRFFEQRVRQAYDEMARPGRLLLQLAVLPTCVAWPRRAVPAVALVSIALAEVGRRRAGGRAHWPSSAPLWALPWVAERSVTAWLAVGARLRGGVRYRGGRLQLAAHRRGQLRAGRPQVTGRRRLPSRRLPALPSAR